MVSKRARLVQEKKFLIEEVEFPKVNNAPIIKVTHTGICGSDVHFWDEPGTEYLNVVMGHEYTGVIEEPGNSGFSKGDRVIGYTQNSKNEACGFCPACMASDFDNCINRTVKVGVGCNTTNNGAYSEYITWFPGGIFKVPENVDSDEAALCEPAAVGLHAIGHAKIENGSKVLISGGGIIGMCCAEWAKKFGAEVIVVTDTNEEKLKKIRELGVVTHAINGMAVDVDQQLKEISPDGFDVFLDCVGVAGATNMGLRAVKKGGRAVFVAVCFKPLAVDYFSIMIKELTVHGSKGHTPSDFKTVIKALEAKEIDMKKYIGKRVKLEDVQSAFEDIKNNGNDFKVLIEF